MTESMSRLRHRAVRPELSGIRDAAVN